MHKGPTLSVIVTTYNWPEALDAVLRSLSQQDYRDAEIIVADDGSRDATRSLIEAWKKKSAIPVVHVWQEDKGFRAAKARNLAISKAQNDFIIFIDGDCVVPPGFLSRYARMAQQGFFISGNRILLEQDFTRKCLTQQTPIEKFSFLTWLRVWIQGGCNRVLPMLNLPLGTLRFRKKNLWEGVKTCNLGIWKKDLWLVNGLDEDYTGWGYEDSDLVIRLMRAGIFRIDGRFALPVFHLWHPVQSRLEAKENFERLSAIQNTDRIKAVVGLDQYSLSSVI